MDKKKKIYLALLIIAAVMTAAEALLAHPHYHMPWNTIPGADILIGFLGAWALIFAAKKVMAAVLQRKNDYYEDGGGKDA